MHDRAKYFIMLPAMRAKAHAQSKSFDIRKVGDGKGRPVR